MAVLFSSISPPKEVQVGDLIKVGTDICIQRNRPTRFDLLCVIQDVDLTEGIRISLPTPTRTWSTDPQNTVIFESSINVDPTFNPDFFEDGFRQILLPGLVGHPLSIGTQGSLLFSLGFEQNLTNPNILPDLPRRDSEYIRDLVFDEILGTYTCLVENEYGCDTATTTISECVIPVIIGFSSQSFLVNESSAYAIVEIAISNDGRAPLPPISIFFPGSKATVGSDFEQDFKLDYSRPDVILVHIPIINDDIFELDEEMKVHLSIVEPIPSNVEISTSETTVTIVDDDILVVCLESVQYSIMEGAPPQTLNVDLTCGNVGEFTLSMTASTNGTNTDSTATAGLDYVPLLGSSPQLSFSGSSTSESVLVNVVADDLEEETEFFEVILSGVEVRDASGMKLVLSHKDQGRIILGQKQARIFILDGHDVPLTTTTASTTSSSPTSPSCSEPPIEFRLRGRVIPNNSQLDILSIGVEGDALHCVTPFQNCCKANRRGEIYAISDSGTATTLPLRGENRGIYRNRGSSLVRLNVRNQHPETFDWVGLYRCCLPDGCGVESCIDIDLI